MSDFSLTTLFVVPVGQTALPSSGSTQDLTAGQVGLFLNTYALATAANIAAAPYFYVAQGRINTYLLGSKRSDKIKGCPSGAGCNANVTEWYKVPGCPTPVVQITEVKNFNMKCGEEMTLTLRLHSGYIESLYFNGLTKSVTIKTPCCECGAEPCTTVDESVLVDLLIEKLNQVTPGINPDNWSLGDYLIFEKMADVNGVWLRITGKPLTKYGQPCDIAANPFEYDRMWFKAFCYAGPPTTADFIVADACQVVADVTTIQTSNYTRGTSDEIKQMEIDLHSYQAGYLKHLYRNNGYNGNFESWVSDGTVYDTYYIKFNELDKGAYNWGDYVPTDSTVIIAVPTGTEFQTALEAILVAALGAVVSDATCITTTSTTTTAAPATTTTTTTAAG